MIIDRVSWRLLPSISVVITSYLSSYYTGYHHTILSDQYPLINQNTECSG